MILIYYTIIIININNLLMDNNFKYYTGNTGPFQDIAPQILILNLILVLTGTLAREPLSLD
jgi:hypothetical protein